MAFFKAMAQTFPKTPEIIYNTIAADAIISPLLGQHEFRGGGSGPALSIVTPGQDLPSLKTTTGVEVVIHDIADMRRRDYYDSTAIETIWKVFVICWKPSTGSDVNTVVGQMMRRFSGATSIETIATADGIGAMVQTMVLIPSDKPILTA